VAVDDRQAPYLELPALTSAGSLPTSPWPPNSTGPHCAPTG
jgi:hypothetical protein